jgi:hypothetical protein
MHDETDRSGAQLQNARKFNVYDLFRIKPSLNHEDRHPRLTRTDFDS